MTGGDRPRATGRPGAGDSGAGGPDRSAPTRPGRDGADDPRAAGETPTLSDWLGARARLVGGGLAVGAPAGLLAVPASLLAFGPPSVPGERAFALGALVLGLGTLGWSGSALAGRGVESMRDQLGVAGDWSEADSRRAMARLVGLGAGAMAGSVLAVVAGLG